MFLSTQSVHLVYLSEIKLFTFLLVSITLKAVSNREVHKNNDSSKATIVSTFMDRGIAEWWSLCLESMRPWVQAPASRKKKGEKSDRNL